MNILLTILAYLMVATLAPFGIFYNLFFDFKNRKRHFFKLAVSLDQLGNVVCSGLLNITMIKEESLCKFGNEDETISSVLGKNYRDKTLTKCGMGMSLLLDTLDPGHVIRAIEIDELNKM